MNSAVIVFPGSNCDRDMEVALAASFDNSPTLVWHGNSEMPDVDLIVIPGGFSYGDYLRAGSMAANSPIMREVVAKAKGGTPVLGVCNGFQILCESGLLPGALFRNTNLKFICRDVFLRVENNYTIFTDDYQKQEAICIPIAHHDGNYYADNETIKILEDDDRITFRYCDRTGQVTKEANPNGSANNIAGIINEEGNVLGMMPHPERLADAALGGTDGKRMFEALAKNTVR